MQGIRQSQRSAGRGPVLWQHQYRGFIIIMIIMIINENIIILIILVVINVIPTLPGRRRRCQPRGRLSCLQISSSFEPRHSSICVYIYIYIYICYFPSEPDKANQNSPESISSPRSISERGAQIPRTADDLRLRYYVYHYHYYYHNYYYHYY